MFRFALLFCMSLAIVGGCRCEDAHARGGKGFLRGWGVRRLLPRNWPRNQQMQNAPACSAAAAPPQSTIKVTPIPAIVDARPIEKPQLTVKEPDAMVFAKAEYCNATFENESWKPIVVVFWFALEESKTHVTGNYRPETVAIYKQLTQSDGERFAEIVARNCVVHPEMKNYVAQRAVRLPYDIYVRNDGRQEIVMR